MTPTDRLDDAFALARALHACHVRKGTQIPYLVHLMSVSAIVMEHGGTEDEAIAALLHDAIEDQGGTTARAKILERFGEDVTAIVDGCTDADTIPKPPWRERKEAYVAHIADAAASVRRVSAADKLHNARAILGDYRNEEIGNALWGRFNADREEILWYYRALADAFTRAESTSLTCELERTVAELELLVATRDALPIIERGVARGTD